MKELANFEHYNTGQTLMAFETPVEIVNRLNEVYDEDGPTNLTNEMTVNRIREDIKVVFSSEYGNYGNQMGDEKDNCNFIPDYIHEWIKDRIHQYLNFVKIPYVGIKPTYAWINDLKAGEYNEIHRHSGGLSSPLESRLGLSALIGLKIPEDMEKNTEPYHLSRDGWTEFISVATSQQFVYPTTLIKLSKGICIIFPYDLLHQVYPHFSNQTRRTMSYNVDVFF